MAVQGPGRVPVTTGPAPGVRPMTLASQWDLDPYPYTPCMQISYPSAPVVPSFRRWDWGGCLEGPVMPSEEVRLGALGIHWDGFRGECDTCNFVVAFFGGR